MTPHAADVLILGCGPAGAMAATLLARWGHAVRLCTLPPADHPCLPESIPPSSAKLLDVLGLQPALARAETCRSTGHEVSWGGSALGFECFPESATGWHITRGRLAHLLLAHVKEHGVAVDVSARRDLAAPTARFILDCTGRHGVLARSRELRVEEASRRSVALSAVWQLSRPEEAVDPTHTLIESYDGGWSWSLPETFARRVIAVMVEPGRSDLARGRPAKDVYLREVAKTVHIAALSRGGVMVEAPSGWDASSYRASRYVDDNILLVGDAGSFVDPLTSAGVKKALASGWLAAVAVHTSLEHPERQHVAMSFYEQREVEIYDALSAMTSSTLARAASGHADRFWAARLEHDKKTTEMADAFARLRAAPTLSVRVSTEVRIEDRAAVSGNEIALQPHLVAPWWPRGERYAFGVDLVPLVYMAPAHSSVPDLHAAYQQAYGRVDLPDFLGALSAALAHRWLDADHEPTRE